MEIYIIPGFNIRTQWHKYQSLTVLLNFCYLKIVEIIVLYFYLNYRVSFVAEIEIDFLFN